MGNTPNVRFKGFTDTWEQRKLGEVAGKIYGGGTPKTSVEEYWNGNIPWIQSSNLSEHELFSVDIQKHISRLGLQKSAAQLVPKNSIAVVSHVGVGKLVVMLFDYTTSQDFISLSELNSNLVFTCYVIYKRLQEDLHIVQGSAIKGITKDDLLSKEVMFPNLPEQEKIGSALQNLDNLITLHQRKRDETKELKKYMLQKMFPQNGKKIPEIRFAGFTGAWEQRKLSDYLVVSTLKNRNEVYDKGNVLSVSGDYGIVNQIEFQGRSFAGESVANYGVVETGDVVYTKSPLKSNPYGIIKTNKGNTGIVSTLYAVYKPNALTDSCFVQIYFEQDARMNNYMHPLVNKGAKNDMKVSAENALKGDVIFPRIDEQHKIVEYFERLDHLITLHQCKYDELKEVKKFMLQNMFPQKG